MNEKRNTIIEVATVTGSKKMGYREKCIQSAMLGVLVTK